ncbi:MAG: hypothetical protein HY348_07370 [Nitrospira defluvii]|nr:hypothetical protein [Nitrospira defluvii]
MRIEADRTRNQVIIITKLGSVITLSWAAAANLSSLLNQASRQAEPPARPGKSYCPSVERDRR